MRAESKLVKVATLGLLIVGLAMVGTMAGFARDKNETIDATANGTSTQLGRNIGVTLSI
jgi:hypothetical protein